MNKMILGGLCVGLVAIGAGVWALAFRGGGEVGRYAARLCMDVVEDQTNGGPGSVLSAETVRDEGGYVAVRAETATGIASCGFERNSLDTMSPALTSLTINGRTVNDPQFIFAQTRVMVRADDLR